MDYPELKRAVGQQAEHFRPTNILIEDKASGTQLIQELIREGVYGVTRYEPTMDKIMRLHSITNTIENGFVYLPTEADWLAAYLHELTTFPSGKHDDQADSTSQALDWMKQTTHTYGVFEYYRQETLREQLGLSLEYRFLQCDEDEEIIAVHKTTGHKIKWTGRTWTDVASENEVVQQEICPACQSKCVGTYGMTHRCNQCGNQWPTVPNVQQGPTRRDVLNGTAHYTPARIIRWR